MSATHANQSNKTAAKKSNSIDLLLLILRELQSIDPEFPLQYALCLLEIAQDEGLSLTTLAERIGAPLSTISRIVGALSDHRQRGAAYGLVTVTISASERRRKELTLSPKGKAIVERLSLMMQTK